MNIRYTTVLPLINLRICKNEKRGIHEIYVLKICMHAYCVTQHYYTTLINPRAENREERGSPDFQKTAY